MYELFILLKIKSFNEISVRIEKIKKINVFGSTGLIGMQTLEIVRRFPNYFQVYILSGGENYKLLADQALRFNPKIILIKDSFLCKLKAILPNNRNIYSINNLKKILEENSDFDISMMAISGFVSLNFSYILAQHSFGKTIAIASKEAIICGGEIFLNYLKIQNILLIPVDSEHNSAFQLLEKLNYNEINNIEKLIITSSGGPFLNYSFEELRLVTIQDAIKHPKWNMGNKISIDSATLMNKALELIEAHYLFGLKVEAIIHPQSIVHAILLSKININKQHIPMNDDALFEIAHRPEVNSIFVKLSNLQPFNGSVISGIFSSFPDMRAHIAHSVFYPQISLFKEEKLDFNNLQLTFKEIDQSRFPFIKIAHNIIDNANHLAIVFNAADEIAVDLFMQHKIKFIEIFDYVERFFNNNLNFKKACSIEEIIEIDFLVREKCNVLLFN